MFFLFGISGHESSFFSIEGLSGSFIRTKVVGGDVVKGIDDHADSFSGAITGCIMYEMYEFH